MPRKQPVQRKQPTTTAMELVDGNDGRISLTIQNAGTVPVALGGDSTVTFSTGLLLGGGGATLDTDDPGSWWAVAQSGTADLRIVETW